MGSRFKSEGVYHHEGPVDREIGGALVVVRGRMCSSIEWRLDRPSEVRYFGGMDFRTRSRTVVDEAPPSVVERLLTSRSPVVRAAGRWTVRLAPVAAVAYSVWYDALAARTGPDPLQVVVFVVTGASLWLARRHPLVPTVLALACWAWTESCSFVMVMSWVLAERRPRWWWAGILAFVLVHPVGLVPDPCAYRAGHVVLPPETAPLLGVVLPAVLGGVVGEARRVVARREARLRQEIALATARAGEAVAEERLRTSRDLHDLVARSASRTALQATALAAVTHEPATAELAGRLAATAASCVEDVHVVVDLLRTPSAPPLPLETLGEAAETARILGTSVTVRGGEVLEGLALARRAALEAALAEGVHNAVVHAPGAPVEVDLFVRGDDVVAEVVTLGPGRGDASRAGRSPRAGAGAGLAVAAERLAPSGGHLRADLHADGAHVLHVEVPR